MIKNTELRIGNWVMYKDNYDQIGRPDFAASYFDYYTPIRITPDILEKCGFHQRMAKIETWWLGDLQLQLDSNFWWRIDCDIDDEDLGCKSRPIYFLHQLQNLFFALTGTELTITL